MKKLLIFILSLLVIAAAVTGIIALLLYDTTDALTDAYKAGIGSAGDEMKSLAANCEKKLSLTGDSYIKISLEDLNRVLYAALRDKKINALSLRSAYVTYNEDVYTLNLPSEWNGFPLTLKMSAETICSGTKITFTVTDAYISKLRLSDTSVGKLLAKYVPENDSVTVDADSQCVSIDMGGIAEEIIGGYVDTGNALVKLIMGGLAIKNSLSCTTEQDGAIRLTYRPR